MKHTLLSIMGMLLFFGAHAQSTATRVIRHGNLPAIDRVAATQSATGRHSGARTTTVTIATENFGTGTDTTLPTGWKAGIINGNGTWKWMNSASSSPNSLGTLSSATAANGWMIYDADSLQSDCSCAPVGWLQSPAYNCSAHTTVRLNFEELFGQGEDTCAVWVSTDSTFATYTSYPVTLNNSLIFTDVTANPALVHINISAAAAGHAAVYIRFVFFGSNFIEYSWLIDDMTLTELDPSDVGISGSSQLSPDVSALNGPVVNTPLAFVDSIYPLTKLTNYGYNAASSVPMSLNIYNGGSSVYSQTISYPSLPANVTDTLAWFPPFKPATTGNYVCAFGTSLSGDADATNNMDTSLFNITDTTWMQNNNDSDVATNFFVNIARFGPPSSSMLGTRFDVPSGATGDTLTGFGVGFSPLTSPTTGSATVSVQLYSIHKGDTGWVYEGTSVARPVTAADISTFTTTKWTYFAIDYAASGGFYQYILKPGTTYAAILQLNHVTTDLLLLASYHKNVPGMNGSLCLSDTSMNDGLPGFHSRPGDTGLVGWVPFIRMYFGNHPDFTGVANTHLHAAGPAYPDPANTVLNIPINVTENETVKVTLYDVTGRSVKTKTVNAAAGTIALATFNTADLKSGVYTYHAVGGRYDASGQVEILH